MLRRRRTRSQSPWAYEVEKHLLVTGSPSELLRPDRRREKKKSTGAYAPQLSMRCNTRCTCE